MGDEFQIAFEGNHIEIRTDADKNLDYARRMWTAVAETCSKHECYDVLGISYSRTPMSITDAFGHAELFRELGIVRGFRIAWVELNESARDRPEFASTVLFNRGLPGRVFDTVTEAKQWLLDRDGN